MHKNYLFSLTKNEIRLSRELFSMEPIPKSHTVHEATHGNLRLGILASDARHSFRSGLGIESVWHEASGEG
ncbi:hypothetical protein EFR01_42150 [Sinorhizobium fredii]|nr:hypothetical protein EFR01_42150 [Sinorhizobium fredii]